jgi:hypothetical protein
MAINQYTGYEIIRATAILDNVSILLADAYFKGKQKLIIEYTNVLSLVKLAKEYIVYSLNTNVIFDTNRVSNAIYIIREFDRYKDIKSNVSFFFDLEKCIGESNAQQITPLGHIPNAAPTGTTNINIKSVLNVVFKEHQLTISNNAQTVFNLPFNLSNIDLDYLSLTVGGDNIKYTKLGIGYHIEGSILYWHGDYELRTNYVVILKYVNL